MANKNDELKELKEDVAKISQIMLSKGYWLCLSDDQHDQLTKIMKRNHESE